MAQQVLSSETTQNVAAGGLTAAGGTAAALAMARQIMPDLLPWTVEGDAAIVAFVATVVTPLLSRWLAFRRRPDKRLRYYPTVGGAKK